MCFSQGVVLYLPFIIPYPATQIITPPNAALIISRDRDIVVDSYVEKKQREDIEYGKKVESFLAILIGISQPKPNLKLNNQKHSYA